MADIEIRSPEQASRILLQGICLQRAGAPTAATVRPALEWALELVAEGHSLPPLGFIADAGFASLGESRVGRVNNADSGAMPIELVRSYEDHVLGKILADRTFERAADALRRYAGRDRSRAIAYVLRQFQSRAGFDGVALSPAFVKSLLELNPEVALARGWESLEHHGLDAVLLQLFESLIASARLVNDVLGPEDVFELEHGTALAELGQRLALRQVVAAAARFEDALPASVPLSVGRREAATTLFDDDAYPVGGFSSIANRGSLESLLNSQLAFMETDASATKPDLFDIKFVRDELLYYSRDENQFFRRRRSFVFALSADLTQARFKDPELPYQRIVLTLALIVSAVRRLQDWLSSDALTFDILFPASSALADERDVLNTVLREQIGLGIVRFGELSTDAELVRFTDLLRRKSECRAVIIGMKPESPMLADTISVSDARVSTSIDIPLTNDANDVFDHWAAVLMHVLKSWL